MYANEESVGVALKEAAIPRQDLFSERIDADAQSELSTYQNLLFQSPPKLAVVLKIFVARCKTA